MKKTLYLFLLLLPTFIFASVLNPWLTSNRSPNSFNAKTIVESVTNNSMTDQEKVIALWRYNHRVMFHFANRPEDNFSDWDVNKMYNVYGFAVCGQTALLFGELCREAGITYRFVGGTGEFGHGAPELLLDGKWAYVDPIAKVVVYKRDGVTIASLADIAADSSLIYNAKEENRCLLPFAPCADGDTVFYGEEKWSSFLWWISYRKYNIDFVYGFSQNNTLPGYLQSPFWNMGKNLRAGESIEYLWNNVSDTSYNGDIAVISNSPPYFVRTTANANHPKHSCALKDTADTANWRFFRPYKKEIGKRIVYRYFANGYQRWNPDLETEDWKDFIHSYDTSIISFADDGKKPNLRTKVVGDTAYFKHEFSWPYIFIDGKISINYKKTNPSDNIKIMLIPWDQHNFQNLTVAPIEIFNSDSISKLGNINITVPLKNLYQSYKYSLIFFIHSAVNDTDCGINKIYVENIFQHNMQVLPNLYSGDNNYTLKSFITENKTTNLFLNLSWYDTYDTLSTVHEHIEHIDSSLYNFTINIPYDSIPRMKSLLIKNQGSNNEYVGLEKNTNKSMVNKSLQILASPNPFNPITKLSCILPKDIKVANLKIYSATGALIKDFNEIKNGESIYWNAKNLSAGVYFAKLTSKTATSITKITYLK